MRSAFWREVGKILSMQRLDYETPKKRKPRSWSFWVAFWLAYMPGTVVLHITDDFIQRRSGGGFSDGGIIIVSLFLSPMFAGAAAVIRAIWKRYDSVGFAISFAIFAPVITFLSLLTAGLFFR